MKSINSEHLSALIKINNISGFLPLDLGQVLDTICKELERLFPPYNCYLRLLDTRVSANEFLPCEKAGTTNCFQCLNSAQNCKAISEQLPLVVYNGEEGRCCLHKDDVLEGFQARICIPLISGTEILGTLSLKCKDAVELSREQLELLLAIANQTAATIQRDRLFSRLAREKEKLEQANREIIQLNRALTKSIEELRAAQHQLIISERLAAVGHLAANLAHEVNNPAGIILARLECMELEAKELNLPDTVMQDLEVIKKHIRRIAGITQGLLTFSRQSREGFEVISPGLVIAETVGWLEDQFAGRNIHFSLDLVDLPPIKGNREKLQQVIVNLLANARDALPGGGEIKILTRVDPTQKQIRIEISDNGTGISPSHLDKIFEPFFTTKGVGKGTGLGLSISYGIIREHGGKIEASSEEGKGTTFSIWLPIHTGVERGEGRGEETQDTGF